MEEQASFEPRSVLGRRRRGWHSLAIIVPALALVATVWAGISGARPDEGIADVPHANVTAAPSADVVADSAPRPPVPLGPQRPRYPAHVVGFEVQRLENMKTRALGRDTPIAVAGWYVATAITDCPRIVVIRRQGSLPEVRHDADEFAYCHRSGVLYASRPDLDERIPRNNLEDNSAKNAGLPAVPVTLVVGVVVPRELEMIGTTATPVVVVGRFVASGDGCGVEAGCGRQLVVDHLAWANGL
jgi:hypothetical protein